MKSYVVRWNLASVWNMFFLSFVFLLLLSPRVSLAVGTDGNLACFPSYDWGCACGVVCHKGGPPGGLGCPCGESTNAFGTAGKCIAAHKCLADTTNGGGLTDPSKLLEMVKGLIDALKGGGGGGGGGETPPPVDPNTGQSVGCTTYHQVTTPSSDPCAIYVPDVSSSLLGSSSLNISNDLLNALNGTNLNTVLANPSTNTNANTNTNNNANTNTNTNTTNTAPNVITSSITTAPGTQGVLNIPGSQPVGLAPGIAGDLQIVGNGATVVVSNQNAQGNSVIAGFYGSDITGTPPQGLVAGWCQTQPWNKNFLSGIIPPTFFDSLCLLRGFKVGLPVIVTSLPVSTPAKTTKPATTTTVIPAISYIKPQADIWAVPATVPLGARTTIFWSTKGVTSCIETSPDGSFSQTSLSGGSATVPLSGATTFTISCNAPDGTHVTNYVTVGLSI